MKSIRGKIVTLKQICELIPGHLVGKLARKHGVDKRSRSFTPWSHVVSMLYGQLSHALSLNDVCDSLRNHGSQLKPIRGAVPPSRNGLSYANKNRNASMAEDLFWETFTHLNRVAPQFGGRNYQGMPRRFKRAINVVDSTTIGLVANCLDWAKHRRRKAAAKCHLSLDLKSFLPRFAIIDSAKHSNPKMAYELCAGIRAGEIVIFDKAYVDFTHLFRLNSRGVFWVTRAKDNMQYKIVQSQKFRKNGKIVRDDIIRLRIDTTYQQYPETFRLVEAWIDVDGKKQLMKFITNNKEWAANSICELYKCRWSIEVFFKQIKQVLQLCDFFGYSENAVKWQIWTALLMYVLLRFLGFINKWKHSFNRIYTLIRGVLWSRINLSLLLQAYGTAKELKRIRAAPEQAYLPGFHFKNYGIAHG